MKNSHHTNNLDMLKTALAIHSSSDAAATAEPVEYDAEETLSTSSAAHCAVL
jgi:hypothetical protein